MRIIKRYKNFSLIKKSNIRINKSNRILEGFFRKLFGLFLITILTNILAYTNMLFV